MPCQENFSPLGALGGIPPSTDKFLNDDDNDDDDDVDDDIDDDDDDDGVDDTGEFRCFQLWRRQPVVILSSHWAVLSRSTFSFS